MVATLQKSGGRPRAPLPPPVTDGQRRLQEACVSHSLTYDGCGQRIGGATAAMVMAWLRGETRPNNPMRARLWGEFLIPPESWNVPPVVNGAALAMVPPAAPPPAAPPPPTTNGVRPSTLDSCLSVLDTLRAARNAQPNMIASEAIKLADAEGRMLALRARLERDVERTEDRLVREHPEWQRLKKLIVKVLTAHPAALKDLAVALADEDLEASGG